LKILLLNDNPVVNKLVTLSANKTSDDLDIVETIDELESRRYDLMVIDDSLYSEDILEKLKEKVEYKKSLFIFSKKSPDVEGFTSKIKKPFLPTDLVELFSTFGKELNSVDLSEEESELNLDDEISLDDDLTFDSDDEISLDEDDDISLDELTLDEDDEISLEDELTLDEDDEISLEDELTLDEDDEISLEDELTLDEDDEISLEDELTLDEDDEISLEEELTLDEDELSESVLDSEEVQEVQDLLEEEESSLELDVEDSIVEELVEQEVDTESLDEEVEENIETLEESSDTLELDDSEVLDDEDIAIEESISDISEEVTDDLEEEDIESQIESALGDLTQEDLESEVDEETLLDIGISGFDTLNSRDLKLALGEDVSELDELEETQSVVTESSIEDNTLAKGESVGNGVEALKNLLTALSDDKVVASMKGMKININITLGDD
jgi:uncharacterized membrane protein